MKWRNVYNFDEVFICLTMSIGLWLAVVLVWSLLLGLTPRRFQQYKIKSIKKNNKHTKFKTNHIFLETKHNIKTFYFLLFRHVLRLRYGRRLEAGVKAVNAVSAGILGYGAESIPLEPGGLQQTHIWQRRTAVRIKSQRRNINLSQRDTQLHIKNTLEDTVLYLSCRQPQVESDSDSTRVTKCPDSSGDTDFSQRSDLTTVIFPRSHCTLVFLARAKLCKSACSRPRGQIFSFIAA